VAGVCVGEGIATANEDGVERDFDFSEPRCMLRLETKAGDDGGFAAYHGGYRGEAAAAHNASTGSLMVLVADASPLLGEH